MKNFRVFLLIILGVSFILTAQSFFSTGVNAQTSNSDSSDAIAVRIMANPNHYSIIRWYETQGFSGAPQALTVDGYEAIRDGRTVYVNATNIDGKNIYTNVYLISYNQSSTAKTVDILGQIVSHWKFNSNIVESTNPVPSCSITNQNCAANSDCGADQVCASVGNASSSCVLKTPKNCLIDSDCPSNFFCNSLKAKIIRDAKRIGQLEELKQALYKYKGINNRFPTLGAGTYLANHSISVWPSWSQNFLANLSVSANFLDPINRIGNCPGYDLKTCWNNNLNKFVFNSTPNYLMLPAGSYAFVYKSDTNGSNYNLCATIESREAALDYHFSPNDPSASACLIDTGVITGGTAANTAPYIVDKFLTGEAGQEFNGYLKVFDRENNPLTWTLLTNGTVWKNWRNNNVNNAAPVFKDSNDAYQKKVYSTLAGDPGDYAFSFKVDDGNGGVLSTSTIIKITNSAPLIEADDGEYVLSAYNPFSYSFTFSDSNLNNPETSFSVTKVSGAYDLWAESRTTSFTSVGINKYKVTHSGIISSTHKFPQDTSFSYQIKVTDKYNVVSTKNFTIKVIVEKPVLDFNCPTRARIGKNYSCILGPSFNADRKDISYSAANSLPADLAINKNSDSLPSVDSAINKNSESLFSINGIARVLGLYNTGISALDEYGATTTKPFSLQVYNYCGDGKKQFPNTEGRGGFYNDGYEDCDGLDGVATSVSDSSITKQYACSTKTGDITPDIITSNDYCTFLSAKNGGGYCGDGYCSVGAGETTCNCAKDCGTANSSCNYTPVCNYTYLCGACQPNNKKTCQVIETSPSGCVGTPLTEQGCTYVEGPKTCHTQADCPSDYTCASNKATYNPSVYYCNGWEGVHDCPYPNHIVGSTRIDCYNMLASGVRFASCKAVCNSSKAVTINGVANSGYCTWSVQDGICYKNDAPVTCTSWTYTDWSVCSSLGQQYRTVIGSSPTGCTGGTPLTSQTCTYTAPTCNYTYSDWTACSSSNQQTRTMSSSLPSGCSGTPVLSQTCTYTPNACNYTYSDWTACSSSNQQTRTMISSSPSGCSGTPVLLQTCTYTAPTCNYTYSDWTACSSSGQHTRTMTGSLPTGCTGTPITSGDCTPACESWTYETDWTATCSAEGKRPRKILTSSPPGCSGGNPVLTEDCFPTCTSWTYSDWGDCGDAYGYGDGSYYRNRYVLTWYPPNCISGGPITTEDCDSCGNGSCDGRETCSNCSSDCGFCCGDGVCTSDESCTSCSGDCGACSCSANEYCPGGYCDGWAGYCTGSLEQDQSSCERWGYWNITALGTCVY